MSKQSFQQKRESVWKAAPRVPLLGANNPNNNPSILCGSKVSVFRHLNRRRKRPHSCCGATQRVHRPTIFDEVEIFYESIRSHAVKSFLIRLESVITTRLPKNSSVWSEASQLTNVLVGFNTISIIIEHCNTLNYNHGVIPQE